MPGAGTRSRASTRLRKGPPHGANDPLVWRGGGRGPRRRGVKGRPRSALAFTRLDVTDQLSWAPSQRGASVGRAASTAPAGLGVDRGEGRAPGLDPLPSVSSTRTRLPTPRRTPARGRGRRLHCRGAPLPDLRGVPRRPRPFASNPHPSSISLGSHPPCSRPQTDGGALAGVEER